MHLTVIPVHRNGVIDQIFLYQIVLVERACYFQNPVTFFLFLHSIFQPFSQPQPDSWGEMVRIMGDMDLLTLHL